MISAVRYDFHRTHDSPRLAGNHFVLVKVIDVDGFIAKSCALRRSRSGSTTDHGRGMWLVYWREFWCRVNVARNVEERLTKRKG